MCDISPKHTPDRMVIDIVRDFTICGYTNGGQGNNVFYAPVGYKIVHAGWELDPQYGLLRSHYPNPANTHIVTGWQSESSHQEQDEWYTAWDVIDNTGSILLRFVVERGSHECYRMAVQNPCQGL